MTNKTKGFIYGAIAAASYGMNPLFALPLYAAGMSVDTVLFYRYFFATIVLGILMKMQHQSFALHKADVLPLVIMGLLFSFSSLLLFMSYNYMDAGIASTILFVYPVMVAVIMGIFFKEKISARMSRSPGIRFLPSCWHFQALPCFIRETATNRYRLWELSLFCCLLSLMLYI